MIATLVALLIGQVPAPPEGFALNDPPPCPEGAAQCDPWERYRTPPGEKMGPGPHTLIVSDRQGMTRIDYATGPKCQKARDEIRRQTAPPPSRPGVIYGRSSVNAFCVPR